MMNISNHFEDSDDEYFDEEDLFFNRGDEDENPVDALRKLKTFVDRVDADAERVQQEIIDAIRDYNRDLWNENELSTQDVYLSTTDFLSIPDKENRPDIEKPALALQLMPGLHYEDKDSLMTPSFGFKTPSNNRTPLVSRNEGVNVPTVTENGRKHFLFNLDPSTSSSTNPSPHDGAFVHETLSDHSEISNEHLPSTNIKIKSPVKGNDPYTWAYAVWRAHGLMGRTGETPNRQIDTSTMDTTPILSFGVVETPVWDLSPLSDLSYSKRKGSATKGADRAKEFARQSTGNFQNVLSTWRKGHLDDTPVRAQTREFASMRKPEKFQDLLRKWREARQELEISGKQRAISYADEARTNIQSILKIWHDSQSAEFECWAKQHAKSPDELNELLSNWRRPSVELGHEDNVGSPEDTHSSIDEIMKDWRESHALEFENWAREQSHSSEEFQELLRQWRDASQDYESSTREVQTVLRNLRVATSDHSLSIQDDDSGKRVKSIVTKDIENSNETSIQNEFSESPQCKSAERADNIQEGSVELDFLPEAHAPQGGRCDDLLSQWQVAETAEFNEWARCRTSSKSSFESLLQKWRQGYQSFGKRSAQRITPTAHSNFNKVLTMWRQSDVFSFEEWSHDTCISSAEFKDLIDQWRTRSNDKPDFHGEHQEGKEDLDTYIAEWRSTVACRFNRWAREHTSSKADFKCLLQKWRDDNPVMTSHMNENPKASMCEKIKGNFEQIRRQWLESEVYSFEDWAKQHIRSPKSFEHVMNMWTHISDDVPGSDTTMGNCSKKKKDKDMSSLYPSKRFGLEGNSHSNWPHRYFCQLRTSRSSEFEDPSKDLVSLDLAVPHVACECLVRTSAKDVTYNRSDLRRSTVSNEVKYTAVVSENLDALNLMVPPSLLVYSKRMPMGSPQFCADKVSGDGHGCRVIFKPFAKSLTKSRCHHCNNGHSCVTNSSSSLPTTNMDQPLRWNPSPRSGSVPENGSLLSKLPLLGVDEAAQNGESDQTNQSRNKTGIDVDNEVRKWTKAKPDIASKEPLTEVVALNSNVIISEPVSTWRKQQNSPIDNTSVEEYDGHSDDNFNNQVTCWNMRQALPGACLEQQEDKEGRSTNANKVESEQCNKCHRSFVHASGHSCGDYSVTEDELLSYWRSRIEIETCEDGRAENEVDITASLDSRDSDLAHQEAELHESNVNIGMTNSIEDSATRKIFVMDVAAGVGPYEGKRQQVDPSVVSLNEAKHGEISRIHERSVAWEKNVVTDIKVFTDDSIGDDENASESITQNFFQGLMMQAQASKGVPKSVASPPITEHSQAHGDTANVKGGLRNAFHHSEASIQKGTSVLLDRTDFKLLRANWSQYELERQQDRLTPKQSVGKERAAAFALDSSVDVGGLRTPWCKDNMSHICGQDTPNEELSDSAGKRRAQEFAKDASVTIRELLERWNDRHFSSLDFRSPDTIRESRVLPTMTPIKDFIAALSAGHKRSLESVSSKDDQEESESLFDDVEVTLDEIPEGEDPMVAPNGHMRSCACASSIFSGNDKLVEFFLPQLGMACTCGKDPPTSVDSSFDDPTAIELILRPWQCEFLKTFGIQRGDQLVKAYHRSAGTLAKAMNKWRKKHDMIRARTVSCGLALHIWSKVCKIYVRSIRHQILSGVEVVKPPTAITVLSQLLTKGDRRVTVPYTGRNKILPESIDPDSTAEI